MAKANIYGNVIKSLTPDAKIVICGQDRLSDTWYPWNNILIPLIGPSIDYMTIHNYSFADYPFDPLGKNVRNASSYITFQKNIDYSQNLLTAAGKNSGIVYTEWGMIAQASDQLKIGQGLCTANILGTFIENNIPLAIYWVVTDDTLGSNPPLFQKSTGLITPAYPAFSLFSVNFGTEWLKPAVSNSPFFTLNVNRPEFGGIIQTNYPYLNAYASRNISNGFMIIINSSDISGVSCVIFVSNFTSAKVLQYFGDSFQDYFMRTNSFTTNFQSGYAIFLPRLSMTKIVFGN